MRRFKKLFFPMLCLVFMSSCRSKGDSTISRLDSYIDSIVKPVMDEFNIPGLSIGVTVDGEHTFFNYGVASMETEKEVSSTTLFELGSISKTFTATLASLSQEQGKLDLRDPVSKYMPELHNMALDKVKLYHLATHTAGGFGLQLPDEVKDEEQMLQFYRNWVPDYPFGTKRKYTNPGIGLLGLVVGRSLNQPFVAAMNEHVFSKLNLNNTFYNIPIAFIERYAQGYNKAGEPVRLNPQVLSNQTFGAKSSTADMLKFIDANMGISETNTELSAALINTHQGYFKTSTAMTQDLIWEQYPYPISLEQLQKGNSNDMRYKPNPVREIYPVQQPRKNVLLNKTGTTNGFGSYVMYIPSKKIGIIILANKNYPSSARIDMAYNIISYIAEAKKELLKQ
ncbi:class C beta-lactamase [Sphingobacterium kitahiroshimense]|uniref:Beta-lactamase n=1 Tax=Sphingobacterium kitahiroshimense TaxID=470446 RepID=A0ABV0BZG2_9SPHI